MLPTSQPDDETLLELLKAKLDALTDRRAEISDPQELTQLSRQYQAVLYALVELGYRQPFDLEDELLFASKPEYDLFTSLNFSAMNMPDIEMQNYILNILTHELRTPLAIIAVCVYILSKSYFGELNEKQQYRLSQITAQADRIGQLVDGLAKAVFEKTTELRAATDPPTEQ